MVNKKAQRGRPSGSEIYRPDYLSLLAEAKGRRGYSHADLARRCGVSRYTIINVLKGRNRSPATIRRVANVVGVSFVLLLS